MGVTDWFRKLFSPSPAGRDAAEDGAILREEYGGQTDTQAGTGSAVVGGASGFASLEDSEAVEEDLQQFEPPADPAP